VLNDLADFGKKVGEEIEVFEVLKILKTSKTSKTSIDNLISDH
jgi:thymidine phosphorylase